MRKVFDTNQEYHADNSVSASGLKKIYKTSVRRWLAEKVVPSKAMAYGTAVHTKILEPENFQRDIFIMPKIDRRSKAGKEEHAAIIKEAEGKTIIDEAENNLIIEINNLLKSKDRKYIWPYLEGQKELSHYNEFNGVNCRCRPDNINYEKGFIMDVKTCQDTSPYLFGYDIKKWGYHLQAAFYSDFCGIDPKQFKFIIVMSKYIKDEMFVDIQLIDLSEDNIERGRQAYLKALDNYKFYKETGICPGYIWGTISDENAYTI
jgi:exodeoxyribonuclease VIII